MPGEPVGDIVGRLRAAGCVYAEQEAELLISAAGGAAGGAAELARMVERRIAGLPLEHVLGWAEFCGIRVAVEPGVFVPRRRTELMVDQAAELLGAVESGGEAIVADLCCGSGAIGMVLATRMDRLELHAADLDPAAVRCARRNIADVGGRVYEGDLFEPLPDRLRGRIDVLIANTPYVPTEKIALMPAEARLHEPRVALDGGADGLDAQRRVAAAAPYWLTPGGHVLVETGEDQAVVAVDMFGRNGLLTRVVGSDELGATVVIGRLPLDGSR
ncbi:putative protein N(5)-glutamine methyltransferase [Phytoactinopolyspora endophytica]|uniref:putative protein N(5)-glutamine methyltransferase n=1 Tax=Phytoactinopolyspora endophytica TaxID=1642495 RepID=UPI00197C5874|nr:putative protein N(5)-glutamine methyltransferase [Phytoactinopolyspora endophytica]